jgi:ribosomal subunit interface protein
MNTQLSARGFELNAELEKYARHKLAALRRRLPRMVRTDVVCTVKFIQKRKREGGLRVCKLTLELPHGTLQAQESTQHMYAALDIVIADVLTQLAVYKRQYHRPGLRRRPTEPSA